MEGYDKFMPQKKDDAYIREEDFDLVFEDVFEDEYGSLYDDGEEFSEI